MGRDGMGLDGLFWWGGTPSQLGLIVSVRARDGIERSMLLANVSDGEPHLLRRVEGIDVQV